MDQSEEAASSAADVSKEDDSENISSTTNTDEANAENTSDTRPAVNPFNNSKVRNADLDDEEAEAIAVTKSESQEQKPKEPAVEGANLFASTNTKNLFAAATSKSSSLLSNGKQRAFYETYPGKWPNN